ncbi:hypothetical protein APS55_03205 [Apilactobacillus kunkeei]|uniref:Uncharacterized protein n=1 Tax=Apilactobacillus kunkeei TaxID=148814 RepID=A0AAC8WBP4_9LACO|nr:hypothetical protein APS55_03205 [Apilactobacillus kunkeei]KFJ15303.1 hypothetical protein JI66_03045 [Apilactobacillus kunkeei]
MYKFGLMSGLIVFLIAVLAAITLVFVIGRKVYLHKTIKINLLFFILALVVSIATYDMDKSFINFILTSM